MELYGLIGRKLGHSFSASYFNDKFSRLGIDARYELFEIESADEIGGLISRHPELRGLNVTIPFKQDIIAILDKELTDHIALEAGAVNTVKIYRGERGIRLAGFNTDIIGFRDSMAPMLEEKTETERIDKALVLGAGGGAARAVMFALREYFCIEPTGVSRHPSKNGITYEELTPEIMGSHRLIVNCTPLGMWPDTDSQPEIPYGCIGERHVCFDLVYNPAETSFMAECHRHGASVKNGLEMLHGQAEAAWKIWNTQQ